MTTLIKNSETISDDNGIEVLVGYNYEKSPSQKEDFFGEHEVGLMIYTELKSVEVVIASIGIDVLPVLTDVQKDHLISKLTYQ